MLAKGIIADSLSESYDLLKRMEPILTFRMAGLGEEGPRNI
jgi:hypothetical protein